MGYIRCRQGRESERFPHLSSAICPNCKDGAVRMCGWGACAVLVPWSSLLIPTEAGLLRATALNLGYEAELQPIPQSSVLGEAGLLRAAALNLGFGAVPQLLLQSEP